MVETCTAACIQKEEGEEEEEEESILRSTISFCTEIEEETEWEICGFHAWQSEHWIKLSWDFSVQSQNEVHAAEFILYNK